MNIHTLGWTDNDGEELFTLGWIETQLVEEEFFGSTFLQTMGSTLIETMSDSMESF